jgi:CRISPR-associated endoribonuclease Cas6
MVLTCFEGIFSLNGEPEDLQFLYDAGMGIRRGQGFGMLELLGQKD